MIDALQRIETAAVSPTLREAARLHWQRLAPTLFEKQERNGIRVSDTGSCIRALWNKVHGMPETFEPRVQLDNLDDGSMRGLWRACVLAASLEADGYYVELEPAVELNGVPGHIDLYFQPAFLLLGGTATETGVIEFKATTQSFHVKGPHEPKKDGGDKAYQILQAGAYAAAKGCENFAIVTLSPSFRDAPMRCDWYELWAWAFDVAVEQDRLRLALGDEEPAEDVKPTETFRCDGCGVVKCQRNAAFVPDVAAALERSLAV